jgi:amino acid permease
MPGSIFRLAYPLSINFILGVGVLALPYAFAQSGTLLTIALLVFVTFLSIVAVIWILDALSVAPSVRSRLSTPLLALSESSLPQAGLGPLDGVEQTATSRTEMHDLVAAFIGPRAKSAYQFTFALFFETSILAADYSVFCSTVADWVGAYILPDTARDTVYAYAIAVFAAIVIPLATLELTEQRILQTVLTACRFVATGLMTLFCVLGIFQDGPAAVPDRASGPVRAGYAFSAVIFAQATHHGIPNLSRDAIAASEYAGRLADPAAQQAATRELTKSYVYSLLSCCLVYACVGASGAAAFGGAVMPVFSEQFIAFNPLERYGALPAAVGAVICSFLVLFPALDLLSAYPLGLHTMANALRPVLLPMLAPRQAAYSPLHAPGASPAAARSPMRTVRLLCSLPPLLLALWLRDLNQVVAVASIFGYAIPFLLPPIFALAAGRHAARSRVERPFRDLCPFIFREGFIKSVLALGSVGFVVNLVLSVAQLRPHHST